MGSIWGTAKTRKLAAHHVSKVVRRKPFCAETQLLGKPGGHGFELAVKSFAR